MRQNVCNIVLGLAVIIISFGGSILGSISPAFQWTFVIIGALIFLLALWGLADDAAAFAAGHTKDPSQ